MSRQSHFLDAETAGHALRSEVRRSLRKLHALTSPLAYLLSVPNRNDNEPRFFVCLNVADPPHDISGLRLCLPELVIPEERIEDLVYDLARSIWQMADYIRAYSRKTNRQPQIKATLANSIDLLIAGDLTNHKKHIKFGTLSGTRPTVDRVCFDTSNSGTVELFYDGAAKRAAILTSHPSPINFRVPIMRAVDGPMAIDSEAWRDMEELGSSAKIMANALLAWRDTFSEIGLFDDCDSNPETKWICDQLDSISELLPSVVTNR